MFKEATKFIKIIFVKTKTHSIINGYQTLQNVANNAL